MEPQIMSNTSVSNENNWSSTSRPSISSDNQILEPLNRLNIEDEFPLLEPMVSIDDSCTYTDLDSFPQTKCNATAMEMPRAIDWNLFNWSTNGAESTVFDGLNSAFQQFYPGYDQNIGYQNCDENKSPNVVNEDYTLNNSHYKISNKFKTETHKQKYTPYLTFICEFCGFDAHHNVTLQIHKLTHAKEQSS